MKDSDIIVVEHHSYGRMFVESVDEKSDELIGLLISGARVTVRLKDTDYGKVAETGMARPS